ncbi:RES family NAD+ phosphorylase [Spongiibacter sp. KMU-158]|uniref:RES family NAD+ phosphorylase n=1 Tax=Spongiibacter pelagi TaxID=2760804 RepID=A0A927GWW7_9GAMM|nr:RES family NAD+ phosphorylase [Spongiibacter pelagi]MBD2859548.1 RES family NAD+ phosphorylase [Spongiibacter pelagi]
MEPFWGVMPFRGLAYRVVESQEEVATMSLVDTLEEQSALEELIEDSKPIIEHGMGRHYLIHTPFRYPPLRHGSRFGSRFEPSIFYAGLTLRSALFESAFYGFYLDSRSLTPYPGSVMIEKTSFAVNVDAKQHADLAGVDDDALQNKLRDKSFYGFTQQLGRTLRTSGVESFSYPSARCSDGVNIGVFHIDTIKGNPSKLTQWHVKQSPDQAVYFSPSKNSPRYTFNRNDFAINGVIPAPSA